VQFIQVEERAQIDTLYLGRDHRHCTLPDILADDVTLLSKPDRMSHGKLKRMIQQVNPNISAGVRIFDKVQNAKDIQKTQSDDR
jgi:hypothetical protein